ncbi:hypothetical protein EYF80_009865 [Liparis tanakae]|uniref:Uncharacterized protein n=1 Tax=Liparis tanakae TaxID=230148 RepID=A0A4Z2IQ69_9TELE|nr:hypothetical protein EYF80_009865 [Liparis tanakae]
MATRKGRKDDYPSCSCIRLFVAVVPKPKAKTSGVISELVQSHRKITSQKVAHTSSSLRRSDHHLISRCTSRAASGPRFLRSCYGSLAFHWSKINRDNSLP